METERVSDWRLSELIAFFSEPGVVQRERYENDTLDALTELRERRAAEKKAEIDYYSNETHT